MSSSLFIERLLPSGQLAGSVRESDLLRAAEFGSESRRSGYLGWRAIVYRELGRDIELGYDEWGGPVVVGRSDIHIGVSHSADYVAVVISDKPCAVDIERIMRNFGHVLPKYLSPSEMSLSPHPDFPAAAWCAKETMYKYCRHGVHNLLSDMKIVAVDFDGGTIDGSVCGRVMRMRMRREKDNIVVFVG